MTIFLILFFISLFSLAILIGRRVLIIQNTNIRNNIVVGDFAFEVPSLEDVKHVTTKKLKKYGYVMLVSTIRVYIKSGITLKNVYNKTSVKISSLNNKYFQKNKSYANIDEASSFLKVISEYKKKVAQIKHMVREEEGL